MQTPSIPTDREVFEGEIATYWFEGEVVVSLSKPVLRTVELIRGNVELVKKITGNRCVPLLIYLSKSPMPDKATRDYSSKMVPEIYSAMAMIAPGALSRLIMSMVFGLKKPPIPMKSFADASSALAWLKKVQQ